MDTDIHDEAEHLSLSLSLSLSLFLSLSLSQIDADVHDALCSDEFQQIVQEIVQCEGSTADRCMALEIAMADKQCQTLAEHGLEPSFQGARSLPFLLARSL